MTAVLEMHGDDDPSSYLPAHVYANAEGHARLKAMTVETPGGRTIDLLDLSPIAGVPVYVAEDGCPACAALTERTTP